jgi:PEP-CTERM motif
MPREYLVACRSAFVTRMTSAAVFVGLLLLAAIPAKARPILDFTGGVNAFVAIGGTFGWSFTVSFPVKVGALGIFDAGADGLADGHALGLWTSGGSLLRSVVITSRNSAPVASTSADGNWRFTPVPQITLPRGHYVIGATYQSGDADHLFENVTGSIKPGVSFDAAKLTSGDGLQFPSTDEPGVVPGYFGPNLFAVRGLNFNLENSSALEQFASSVPEPSSLLLFGSAVIGIPGLRRILDIPRRGLVCPGLV